MFLHFIVLYSQASVIFLLLKKLWLVYKHMMLLIYKQSLKHHGDLHCTNQMLLNTLKQAEFSLNNQLFPFLIKSSLKSDKQPGT